MLDTLFFYAFAALTVGGAVLTVTMRNAIHCALALIASLSGVAGLFLLQKAEFLFAVQIVLYIGGIMVLFLFVIMLVNLDQAAKERQYHRRWLAAAASVVGTGVLLSPFIIRGMKNYQPVAPPVQAVAPEGGNVESIAETLFREYLVPFELASLLLLVAIVGSVIMAKKKV